MADDQEPGEEIEESDEEEDAEKLPDGPLTGKLAYELHEEQGIPQTRLAEAYDCSQPTVSRRIKTYRDGIDAGRESVDPSQFDRDDLRNALTNAETDDPYTCGTCGGEVAYLQPRCNQCDGTLNWGGL